MVLLVAAVAGAFIGLSLGALGGGGSILAVPVLVYLLGQSPQQATSGSLVVVGVTSLLAVLTAHRQGRVMLGRGVVFGLVAVGGATLGALASAAVPAAWLMAGFAVLMLVVALVMVTRLVRGRGSARDEDVDLRPIIAFQPAFVCRCPAAAKVLVTSTVVGLLTGFLGVGGGFLVVPALLLALSLPMAYAAGTSLVVITLTSASALVVRAGSGLHPDWLLVGVLTLASALAAVAGARLATRVDTTRLQVAFTGLVLLVAVYTAAQALPALA